MSSVAIGIDLGTSFSCAAVYREGKGVEFIPGEDGDFLIPSVVYFDPETGNASVGKLALDDLPFCPRNGLFDAKRIIGRKFDNEYVSFYEREEIPFSIVCNDDSQVGFQVTISNQTVFKSPEEVTAEILKHIKRAANLHLGSEITEAVISVPVHFSIAQRKATKKAAEMAGLNVLRLISEPTAAAIHYFSAREITDSNTLIFDFGGGKLDASIIKIIGKQFEVKAAKGDSFLGGRNIDELLFDYFKEEIFVNRTVESSHKEIFLKELKNGCLKLKKKLSFLSKVQYSIPSCFGDEEEIALTLTREQLVVLTDELFDRCLEILKLCLNEANMSSTDIDEVVLVGGSTRIPLIQTILSSYFGRNKLKTNIHKELAVAAGASIQAALSKAKELEKYKISEVVPFTLGIDLKNGLMEILLPRNSPLPYKTSIRRITSEDNQEFITFEVYEGERKNPAHNNILGIFTVHGLPLREAGNVVVMVEFALDEDGLLNVMAYEGSTGVSNPLAIRIVQFCLSERIRKISLEETEKHREEDAVYEKFILYRNEAQQKCNQILSNADEISPKDDQEFVNECCQNYLNFSNTLEFTELNRLKAEFAIFNNLVTNILENNCLLQGIE